MGNNKSKRLVRILYKYSKMYQKDILIQIKSREIIENDAFNDSIAWRDVAAEITCGDKIIYDGEISQNKKC
jgi:hypothetical protein